MQPDRNPTFAEALLALVIGERIWYHGCPISTAWNDACERACTFARGAPPEIRRALGADKQMSEPYDGLPIGHLISLIASAKRGDPIQQADVDALEEWRSTRSPVVDKQPVIEPRELALEKQLADAQQDARDATTMIAQAHREKAAAVARAEKAEAQMRNDSAARQMAESGRASAFEAMCTIERARDSLRAELDKAKAELDQAKAYNSAAYKNGVVSVRAADATGRSNDCQAWLQACLHAEAERDALAAKLAEKEAARVRIYNELIAYQHERDRLAGILDRAGRILDEAAARKALDAKEQS